MNLTKITLKIEVKVTNFNNKKEISKYFGKNKCTLISEMVNFIMF